MVRCTVFYSFVWTVFGLSIRTLISRGLYQAILTALSKRTERRVVFAWPGVRGNFLPYNFLFP